MEEKAYSAASLETAACLWEAVLELLGAEPPSSESSALAQAARERIGTSGLRLTVIGWTDAVDAAWKVVDTIAGHEGSFSGSFDWDFVPSWLAANVDWTTDYPTLRVIR